MTREYTYLASPYSSPDAAVRQERYETACRVAARMMACGDIVFSPIAHSHPIALHLPSELTCDFDFWMRQDLPILRAAAELVVLKLDGWKESRGVAREISEASIHNIPVRMIDP